MSTVAAVVVDYDAEQVMVECIESLAAQGAQEIVVVENGDAVRAAHLLAGATASVPIIDTGRNVGYGAGANRGVAATAPGQSDYVLVCNPDLRVHEDAVARLVAVLDAEPAWAIVGPTILTPEGDRYPSVRRFPSMTDAVGHALIGVFHPDNPFTRRYRSPLDPGEGLVRADWVSGACFLARRSALEELGGFDESYFMFAEDMDLCWRAHRAGWGVGAAQDAVVTHVEGVSRRRHPYRMLMAHHRSAWRFAVRSTEGWRRAALPAAAVVLGFRLAVSLGSQALALRGVGADTSAAS